MDRQTTEDLLMDDSFLAWYYFKEKNPVIDWDEWQAASEDHRRLVEEAGWLLTQFTAAKATESSPPSSEVMWRNIQAAIRRKTNSKSNKQNPPNPSSRWTVIDPVMLRNYIKVGFRSLVRNKVPSFINIFGLSMGMAVTLLIGLWIWDELTYDTYFQHYDRIAQVWEAVSVNGQKYDGTGQPVPLADELRQSYGADFQNVVLYMNGELTLSTGDRVFTQQSSFMEDAAPEMLSLNMIEGNRAAFKEPSAVFISQTTASKLFGNGDPMGRLIKINNAYSVKVSGVYQDLPRNTSFKDINVILPWSVFMANAPWVKAMKDNWKTRLPDIFVQLYPQGNLRNVSGKIKGIMQKMDPQRGMTQELFLHPMQKWHLYGQFKDGVNTGGLIEYVWLFGTIGLFVLLLACINFMNLSTARSEKRAREVGIRKVMGSIRGQLIGQFFSESIVMTLLAFAVSLLIVQSLLPWFNGVADKNLSIPWTQPWFWVSGVVFSLGTGLIAGSYPALYLSSFQPVKVLKGTFKVGRLASIPRQVMVVVQFTVSVLLITGTIIVYRQIRFAKDRPVGYDRNGLIDIRETTPEIYTNYAVIRKELIDRGAALELSESQCPITDIWAGSGGFDWKGKDPNFHDGFSVIGIRHEFGKTIGWKFVQGRDFSKDFITDSDGIVLNQAAVNYMGLKDPVGETIRWNDRSYKVLGVVKDMIMASPYQSVPQTIFYILREGGNVINIRLNPSRGTAADLKIMEDVFKKYNPGAPFNYTFVDQDYARKFKAEERIGKLASFFALLAILISCLGLYGLVAFVAEQRTKEIGIRKVLGASIFQVWRLLSRDFVVLVTIALFLALPLSWYFMTSWLKHYQYRTALSWWVFAASSAGALALTLLTVSYQAIKAALLNPVNSLRSE